MWPYTYAIPGPTFRQSRRIELKSIRDLNKHPFFEDPAQRRAGFFVSRIQYHIKFQMTKWQNRFFHWSKAAALDWATALARAANAAPVKKQSVPQGCVPCGRSQRSALLQVSRYSQEHAPCAASIRSSTVLSFHTRCGTTSHET